MRFYLVELDAHHNNGQCDCAQFIMRCGPMLDERWASARWHRCKHIQAARDFFCDEVLKRITDERKRIRNETKKANQATV